ncbi:hypothetical protein V2J09_020170 [Rumex salicifolius]
MSFRGSNASSGMGVADNTLDAFMELKRKKVHRYVIFKIDEKKREIVVEKTGDPTESYDDFSSALPDNDCRYAMLYATSKERIKRALDGIHYEIQATDPTEMDLEVLRERAH